MITGTQMATVTVSHSKDRKQVVQVVACGTGTGEDVQNRATERRGRSRDQLGIVVRQSAELFASP